jgi:multiple sugar transport system ATP-binding protein
MASVDLLGLTKSFGAVRVLTDVSLGVRDGEFLTLLGPSGCGKSTLLRIVAGLERQDAGQVRLDLRPVDHEPPKRRNVAMVFQSYALYPHMTVFDNLALPLEMRRLSSWQRAPLLGRLLPAARAERRRIAGEVRATAAALAIEDLLGRKPGQLSGGQKQRVALGRAMVRHPAVFLMDEPLSNLDAKLRVHMRAELVELQRRLGATMIYVTHDQVEAMTMSHRVAVMLGGRLLQVASPRAIYADPACLDVAEFVGSPRINVLPARHRTDGGLEALGVALGPATRGMAGSGLRVGVRPEALELAPPGAPGCLAARVRHVEHLGPECLVHAEVGGLDRPLIARLEPAAALGLEPGHAIGLRIAPDSALLFDGAGRRLDGAIARAAPEPVRG